jgi:hypothetical protein
MLDVETNRGDSLRFSLSDKGTPAGYQQIFHTHQQVSPSRRITQVISPGYPYFP